MKFIFEVHIREGHTAEEYADAMEGQHNPEVAAIIRSAAPFVDINPIGEFEDPEWVVDPPRSSHGHESP